MRDETLLANFRLGIAQHVGAASVAGVDPVIVHHEHGVYQPHGM